MDLILVLHNIRSTYNVGAILRSAEGFGVERVICSGYTPTPLPASRALPHIAEKETAAIHKTALGAEEMVELEYADRLVERLGELQEEGYVIMGLENNIEDKRLRRLNDPTWERPQKGVLILGEEVAGIAEKIKEQCEVLLEIPMCGRKESFNVSVAAGVALYELLVRR